MKKLVGLCLALLVSGCGDSVPDEGDLKKFLGESFGTCSNIKVANVKKINGYPEEQYYKVEYSYEIKADAAGMKKLIEQYEREVVTAQNWDKERAAHEEHNSIMHEELNVLRNAYINGAPKRDISVRLSNAEEAELWKRREAWDAQHLPAIEQKKKAIDDAVKAQWQGQQGREPLRLVSNTASSVEAWYREGCGPNIQRFTNGIIQDQRVAAEQSNDQTKLFELSEIGMQGVITMRKTENGWQAL